MSHAFHRAIGFDNVGVFNAYRPYTRDDELRFESNYVASLQDRL